LSQQGEKILQMIKKWQTTTKRSEKNRLTKELLILNRGLVIQSIHQYTKSRHGDKMFDLLVQEGDIAIITCLQQFNPARGNSFYNFAKFKVMQAVIRAANTQGRIVPIPREINEERIPQMRRAKRSLEQQLQRQVTLEEIDEYLEWEIGSSREYLLMVQNHNHLDLDAPISEKSQTSVLDSLVYKKRQRGPNEELLEDLVTRLPLDIQKAVILHYYEGFQQKQIAKIIRVTPKTVQKRVSNGVKLLKEMIQQEIEKNGQ